VKSKVQIVALSLFLLGFAVTPTVEAQSTLFVSNIGSTNLVFVGLGANYWMAQPFITGTNPSVYVLNSIQLTMLVTGPSSGTNLQVSLFSNNGGMPGTSMGMLSGSDPTTSGPVTYTASGIILAPMTPYWLLISSGLTQFGFPVFLDGASQTTNYMSSGGWSLNAPMYSTDMVNWQAALNYPAQIAIRATTPEPPVCAFIGLGLALYLIRRRR